MSISLRKFSDEKDHLITVSNSDKPVLLRGVSFRNIGAARTSLRSKYPQMIRFSSGRVL
jgi:hypothetical protein